MRIEKQRAELIQSNLEARMELTDLINFLSTNPKFQGAGDDWIRTGEVTPILRKIVNDLQNSIVTLNRFEDR